jgi:hypothetical protein
MASSSTKRPLLSVDDLDDDMQIDIEDAEGDTFLERMRNRKKKNYKQRLFFDFECHKFINENDFTNIFCARMECKINYDKVTDEWFAKFEKAKACTGKKGEWIRNPWFYHQLQSYKNKRCTVFTNENCKKEFELFCDGKGIKLQKLCLEKEWFAKFEKAKDFKDKKGKWIQNEWFQTQVQFYKNKCCTVFTNENCKKEFKLFCDEKGITLEKKILLKKELTPEEEWFAKFEEAKNFKNEKGNWIQNEWFQDQLKHYRNKRCTVFNNENCEKEFKLFCEEKGKTLEKKVNELTPEEEWFAKFEEAKNFKNKKGKWVQNDWVSNQLQFYKKECSTVFNNKICKKEFEVFCDEKGKKLKKTTPGQNWKNRLYDVCKWMYTHKKRPTSKYNTAMKCWICSQNRNYKNNKYIMKSDNIVRDIWKQIQNYMNNKEWDLMKEYVKKLQKEDEEENMNEDDDQDMNMNMNMNNNHVEYDEDQQDEDHDTTNNNKAFENDNREYRSNELKLVSTRKEYFSLKQKEFIKSKQDYKCMNSPGSEFERLYEYQCPCYRRGGDGRFDRNDLCDVDHIVATNRGGTSNIDNGMALCLNCHRVKTNYEKKNKNSM